MRKSILISALFMMFTSSFFAQTSIINDFRIIINDRPNEFKNLQKELLL